MAITKVVGNILADNLQRAANLSIQGNLAYFNITNNRVGVLTSAPAAELHVVGNIIGSNISTGGLITATGNINTSGGVLATGNVTGGNLVTGGLVTATGNVNTSAGVSATGNLSGNYLLANIAFATGYTASKIYNGVSEANIGVANGNANISIAGTSNVAVFATTGVYITGVSSASGNVTGGNLITTGLTSTGTLLTSGDATITGNLRVQGNLTYVNVTDLKVVDPVIQLGGGANGSALSSNDGKDRGTLLSYYTTAQGNAFVGWDNSSGNMVMASNVSIANDVVTFNSYGTFQAGNAYLETATVVGNVSGGNLNTGGAVSATGNLNTAAGVSATGNISGNYLLANIAFATGYSASKIYNGTSEANIGVANGNANISIGGTSNVVVVATTGVFVNGVNSASGNVTGGNLITAGLVTSTGNVNTSAGVLATGNVRGGNIQTGGLITATGNVITAAGVTATGNVTGGNITTAGLITATGNILGNNLILSSTSGFIDLSAAGRITINGSDIDVDFAVDGDTAANVFYVDAGTGTASFGTSTQTTNAIVAFNTTNSILVPVGNTSQRPAVAVTGMVRFNTTNNVLEYYTANTWQAAQTQFTTIVNTAATGDGTTVNFTLPQAGSTNGTLVTLNGVTQDPVTAYSVSGTTLTFTEAPWSGADIQMRQFTTTTSVTSIQGPVGSSFDGNASAVQFDVTGNLIPTANVTYNLGSTTNRWKDLWLSGTTLTLGNVVMKNVAGGNTIGFYGPDGTTPATIASTSVDTTQIANGTSILSVVASGGNIRANIGGATIINITSAGIENGQANGVGNIGSATTYFNTVFAKATSAQYADLAEKYVADAEYAPGTVLAFGGNQEVTVSTTNGDRKVAGVVTTNPSYIMNSGLTGEFVATVALTGRVPCRVTGAVSKGDMMVSNGDGTARAEENPTIGSVIGKALENFAGTSGVIEVVVGRQ